MNPRSPGSRGCPPPAAPFSHMNDGTGFDSKSPAPHRSSCPGGLGDEVSLVIFLKAGAWYQAPCWRTPKNPSLPSFQTHSLVTDGPLWESVSKSPCKLPRQVTRLRKPLAGLELENHPMDISAQPQKDSVWLPVSIVVQGLNLPVTPRSLSSQCHEFYR